jgi:cell division protein FtsI (penicillin-binding protein 3)
MNMKGRGVCKSLFLGGMVLVLSACGPKKISTIDPILQDSLTAMMERKMEEIVAHSGQAIIMEVQTGEIKAMVGEGKPQSSSLMRTVSLLAALESGKVKLSDTVDTKEGVMMVDDEVLKDHNWHRGGYGEITVLEGVMVSSNIATYLNVDRAFGDGEKYIEMLRKMNYEVEEILTPRHDKLDNSDLAWLSIGYNQQVYPYQMLTFYNAIANGGKMVKPMLYKGKTEIINPQIASKENVDSVQLALTKVVSEGLGKPAASGKVQVAGATGTSQISIVDDDSDKLLEYSVEFCGFFPADHPKYSIIVSMNKMGLPASGGLMAGSVFSEIVDLMVEME